MFLWELCFLSPLSDIVRHVTRLSRVRLVATPWTVAYQDPPSMDFPGKSTGVGYHFLLQGILPTQGLNPGLPHWRHLHINSVFNCIQLNIDKNWNLYHWVGQKCLLGFCCKLLRKTPNELLVRVLSGKREESCQHLASFGDFSFFFFFFLSSLAHSLYTLLNL